MHATVMSFGTLYRLRNSVSLKVLSTSFEPVYGSAMAAASSSAGKRVSLRDRTKRLVRAEITASAMDLLRVQGYDETTVEEIAEAAGISRTTFFRYFGSKEDIVFGHIEELNQQILAALAARPADEPVWQSLRRAADILIVALTHESPRERRKIMRMVLTSPALRARRMARAVGWHDLLTPEVARRMGVTDLTADPRPRAVVGAAHSCLSAAFDTWSATDDETVDLAEIVDLAMSAPRTD